MEELKIITFTMKSGRILQGIVDIKGEKFEEYIKKNSELFDTKFVGFVNARNRKSYIIINTKEIESFEVLG